MNNLIFLDCESTGFKNARLVQLAYKLKSTIYNKMFYPERDIDFEAMAVHHITNEMVADCPKFKGSEDQAVLQDHLRDNVMVAHNARFDIGILNTEGVIQGEVIDTYKCAKKLLETQGYDGKHKLQILRYSLDLNIPKNIYAHDALCDVIVLEQLFFYLLTLAKGETAQDKINHMIELSK